MGKPGASWGPEHSTDARGSVSDNWGTNSVDFESLKKLCLQLYGVPFAVDAAASLENHLCDTWYGPGHPNEHLRNALEISPWEGPWFCNPPYSLVDAFVDHICSFDRNDNPGILLVFARLDTKWAWRSVLPESNVIYVRRGRCKFRDPSTGKVGASAPTPSMAVCYGEPSGRVRISDDGLWYPLFPTG